MKVEKATRRPLCTYFGGKWRIAPWVIEHMPPHDIYLELFGGMASVLLCKPKAKAEVYNDRDGDVVNLFRVLIDPDKRQELVKRVAITPYSRDLFVQAWRDKTAGNWQSDVERAWLMLVCTYMAYGSSGSRDRKGAFPGFEVLVQENGACSSSVWAGAPDLLVEVARRFAGVVVENRDWEFLFDVYDGGSATLFYIDPPYLSTNYGYNVAFTVEDHERLLKRVTQAKSMVMLSGYENDLYRDMLADWAIFRRSNRNIRAEETTECLWLNPQALDALETASGKNALIRACS